MISIARLIQNEGICRQQNKYDAKTNAVDMDRKHCGEKKKCWLPLFFPFPATFYKSIHLKVVESRDCVVVGL